MNRNLLKKNQVSVCHKENCIHAFGENADMIAKGAMVMLLLIGFAAIVKAASN
jgi:hypothetical protein